MEMRAPGQRSSASLFMPAFGDPSPPLSAQQVCEKMARAFEEGVERAMDVLLCKVARREAKAVEMSEKKQKFDFCIMDTEGLPAGGCTVDFRFTGGTFKTVNIPADYTAGDDIGVEVPFTKEKKKKGSSESKLPESRGAVMSEEALGSKL